MLKAASLLIAPVGLLAAALLREPPVRVAERIDVHDNERPAGVLRNGVLTLDLDARIGTWHPHGPRIEGMDVPALGESRGSLQIPSPLIRVPAGTDVVVRVRNTMFATLALHGLVSRPIRDDEPGSVRIAPGETRELRFRLDAPGVYYYWGTTMDRSLPARTREDSQINGAIVVDPPGTTAARARDRILVVGHLSDTTPSEVLPDALMRQSLLVINGRSWPATTRFRYTVGDTVRWHLINTSAALHPMHLHGFYFTVDARGDGRVDTTYAADRRDLVVTERLRPGSTFSMTWVPERAGNWLFHCHITSHFSPRAPLGLRIDEYGRLPHAMHTGNHAEDGMSGLVVGVSVAPRRTGARTRSEVLPRHRVRMLVREHGRSSAAAPIYDVALHDGGAEPSLPEEPRAGPPLVLERDVPAEITVVNRTSSATSIHWHGMELESYFDGVAGFSGRTGRISPLVQPGDSFRVRMTPPRAGTFIYHTHVDEERQQPGGLSGALIVLEPGARWDPSTDIPVLIAAPPDSATERRAVLVNGSTTPAPITVRAGVAHRLRIINITTTRPGISAVLTRDTAVVTWRALAKDGADLPASRRVEMPARQVVSIGETFDFEFVPAGAGEYRLSVRTVGGATLAALPFVVAP